MENASVLVELEKLAARLGLVVRYEAFDLRVIEGRGGLCLLHGVPTVLIDGGLPLLDKIGVLVEVIARFDVAPIYTPPRLRARIDRCRDRRWQRLAS